MISLLALAFALTFDCSGVRFEVTPTRLVDVSACREPPIFQSGFEEQ